MSIEEEIKSKVREISRDLEEDRELQLDVEMELESHLWESYDNALDRGLSEAESKEHAFKEFGEIVEVKSRIISGNIKRMKSRARLKVLLWYAFLPLALLSALYLGWSELSELHMVNDTMRNKTRIIAQVEKDSPLI
ncbi:MAG: hypothetical protein MK132_03830 [Lentisphaerales bacterium]|nr:hypothetical protein [Lentisphaerales bacterium]